MIFDQIAGYIEENVSSLKTGTTIFINQMPADIEFGVLLKDGYLGTEIDEDIPGLRRGKFQIIVRGKNRVQCLDTINAISEIMSMDEYDFDGVIMKSLRPTHEPIPYMVSIGNNYEYSVNLSAIYVIVP